MESIESLIERINVNQHRLAYSTATANYSSASLQYAGFAPPVPIYIEYDSIGETENFHDMWTGYIKEIEWRRGGSCLYTWLLFAGAPARSIPLNSTMHRYSRISYVQDCYKLCLSSNICSNINVQFEW